MSNKNVELIRGEPEKAIRKLAFPLILAMLLMASYNVVDGIWVAGLGGSALAAIGFVFPLFMVVNGLTNGLAVGITSVSSRFIGARNKEGADSAATHSIVLLLLLTIFSTILILIFQEPILNLMGAEGTTKELAMTYGTIVFSGTFAFMFSNGLSGIFRGEGDMKRTTIIMAISSILNMILDPIFIYLLDFKIAGAAIATVLSSFISALVIIYWLLIKKDTYVDIIFKNFKLKWNIIKKILSVGIPASLEMMIMASSIFIFNTIISGIGGSDGVAIFSTGQRLIFFSMVPLMAIASTIVTVVGSAYGAKNVDYMSRAHLYGIKLGVIIGFIMTVIFMLFSNQLAYIFTYSPQTAYLHGPIANFLLITSLAFIFIPLGMSSSTFYQGLGKGSTSLFFTILREILLALPFVYLLTIYFNFGLTGAWFGLIIGRSLAGIINFTFARYTVSKLRKEYSSNE